MNIYSNPRRLHCRGAAAIWLVLAIPALLMLAWFGIEMGLATKAVRHAKAASDSSALAAALSAASARSSAGVAGRAM